ncbi:hypothetical protein GLYMA_18G269800v4 [Glycine max]|uniref:Uncharacterized protein n=1 Tax=Glycine max TaxID=3847 RepID=K7MV00_SOYBN|nr:uncharacterized protein LOC100500577 precursor [Glycine max]KAH1156345.1 hypothetical protein GYH30_051237 [Glycine max]KRH01332.1 hypothetical protein GLYMA_18G269800v4 [Glycine max]|eukprot:NP_001236330.2 uncharacterized protein LOC100500577 precursor [Glycine max]
MKKQLASRRLLMWVMVHLSISGVLSKSNHTTTSVLCDGSVEDCLHVHHLDSQLPTISSSHFRRILAEGSCPSGTGGTSNPGPAACSGLSGHYVSNGAKPGPGTDSRCADPYAYHKGCY